MLHREIIAVYRVNDMKHNTVFCQNAVFYLLKLVMAAYSNCLAVKSSYIDTLVM
jgi:hypothetical protein